MNGPGFKRRENERPVMRVMWTRSAEGRSPDGTDDAAPVSGRTIARRHICLGYSRRGDDHMAL